MVRYKDLLHTRSDNLIMLLKFLFDVNEIDYIIENEHIFYYAPDRNMRIKVDEKLLQRAKELVGELPNRFRRIEAA